MIIIKSWSEIKKMQGGGRIAYRTIELIKEAATVGITTLELDKLALNFLKKNKARPAFLGYKNYPATLCTSVNDQVVHGIPGPYRLKSGDILSVDMGVYHDGYYTDIAITIPVGEISEEAERLIAVTEESFYYGLSKAKVGHRLFDISVAIQSKAEDAGYSVVREFVGHGIGRSLHEEPQLPNYGESNTGPRLKPGMTFCIEPMVNAGREGVKLLSDGWTVATQDGSLSAHFEHTVAITPNGPLILTKE